MKIKGPDELNRRDFLLSVASVAGVVVTGVSEAATPCPPPAVSVEGGTTASTACVASQPGQLPKLTLTAGTSGTHAWSFGHAFAKGDVPAGSFVTTSAQSAQADVRNRWPDGSVKFAVLSGVSTFTQGSPLALQLSTTTTSPSGSNVAVADLKATGVTAAIGFGSATASWSAADWDSPARSIVSGPNMSSWTYRKPLGGDAHLVAWLEVRCYRSGQVEVLPWIENGYLNVAGATTKSGRATFTLNGSSRYDSNNDANYTTGYSVAVVSGGSINMAHHTRIVLVSGGRVSHWLGTDPQIAPTYDRAYLASSKLVPAYRPATIVDSALAPLTTYYSPMRVRYLSEGMGTPGYAPDIGVLPKQAATYLVSGDPRAYRACVAEGLSLASYSIHYRDESTNRPLAFSSYPTLSINVGNMPPDPSGSVGYNYASSHHPAAAYVPYLVTGWNWFVEEIQFQNTLHYLARNASYRQNANFYFTNSAYGPGLNEQGGPRSQAWTWRTCAMAANITPDSDTTLRNQFVAALNFNANYWRTEHETGAVGRPWAPNNLGCAAEPGYDGSAQENGKVVQAPWQDDFITAAVGLTWDLEVITDAARRADLLWFRNFKYRAIVGRLGQQNVTTEWNYRFAAQYQTYIGTPTGNGDTFNWYPTWGEAFASKKGQANSGLSGTDLQDGNIASFGLSESYWGNLQPAISFAVDHQAPGALAAYNRMVGSSNFAAKATEFESNPGWGVKPRTI